MFWLFKLLNNTTEKRGMWRERVPHRYIDRRVEFSKFHGNVFAESSCLFTPKRPNQGTGPWSMFLLYCIHLMRLVLVSHCRLTIACQNFLDLVRKYGPSKKCFHSTKLAGPLFSLIRTKTTSFGRIKFRLFGPDRGRGEVSIPVILIQIKLTSQKDRTMRGRCKAHWER